MAQRCKELRSLLTGWSWSAGVMHGVAGHLADTQQLPLSPPAPSRENRLQPRTTLTRQEDSRWAIRQRLHKWAVFSAFTVSSLCRATHARTHTWAVVIQPPAQVVTGGNRIPRQVWERSCGVNTSFFLFPPPNDRLNDPIFPYSSTYWGFLPFRPSDWMICAPQCLLWRSLSFDAQQCSESVCVCVCVHIV